MQRINNNHQRAKKSTKFYKCKANEMVGSSTYAISYRVSLYIDTERSVRYECEWKIRNMFEI